MSPYFSIILPIYNVAPYLERCVRSVLDQAFCDYELILVDDGSTDGSSELCDALAAANTCIRVIHKENGGLSSARNAGMKLARGQYIWWVDSDDWIEKDALQILYNASFEQKPDAVKFHYIRVQKEHKPCKSNAQPGLYNDHEMQTLLNAAFYTAGKFCLSACCCIYSSDFLKNQGISFLSERIVGSEDYLFNMEVLLLAKKVQVIPQFLYYYEQRNGSLTQQYKKNLPERYLQLYAHLQEFCQSTGNWEKYDRKICRFFVWHLLHGTCLPNEYQVTGQHSLAEGRRNVCEMLCDPLVKHAIKRCDRQGLRWKQRIQLWAMGKQIEPLFYWLYVIKPKRNRREAL